MYKTYRNTTHVQYIQKYNTHVQQMYNTHVQHTCTTHMYNTHVQHTCTIHMYNTHVRNTFPSIYRNNLLRMKSSEKANKRKDTEQTERKQGSHTRHTCPALVNTCRTHAQHQIDIHIMSRRKHKPNTHAQHMSKTR
jgi:hypothetical protein